MNKFLFIVLSFFILSSQVFATQISKYIKETGFSNETQVAVYIANLETKDILYKKNANKPLNPASGLKLLTLGTAYTVLGKNYNFETSLYEDEQNNIYLKLGGDVLLSQSDLEKLISNLKNKKIKNIYIDDSIFDKTPYPNTWLKEDEWPNYGMVTPYIIDSNLIQISINRSSLSKKVDVISNSEYKIPIINELEIGEKNNFQILRLYGEDSSIINLKGEISQDEQLNLFVLKPELNFNIKLNSALEKNGIIHNEKAEVKIVPSNAKKIASIERPIRDIARLVLHNSCNIESEVIFKVAASKYYDKTASLDDAIKMFMEFHGNKFGKNEKIVDASGVSRENKISLKTLNAILFDLYKKTDLITLLPTADEGTLSERLVFLKGNLKAKTGTLKKYSSLNGVLTTRNNNKVIFSIAVQNSDKRKSLLKNFENTLVGIIYKNY